ncbi:hypothetical protein [Cohnella cholangitidis]|uniref:Uncharacterized protein n=1 Tax=Cohnella cholangitidis TaxID=2598458 RepID=A0A7G5C5Z1_9BACL|nr:hypothetical protein [Cohnella cholangitidis]QMV44625.1 hypothetical protein FPL14_28225 [Cohnella cholangitidis]
MSEVTFNHYMQIARLEDELSFRLAMEAAGYFAFYTFIEDFRNGLKNYSDVEADKLRMKISRARSLFPAPERFSPSWSAVWDEFELISLAKNEALATIPANRREGEWQVLLDNPYSHQQVVCYPGLGFLEAAYMYGYFQRELKPNEVLRLQKVTDLIRTNGRKEASILPDN